MHTAGPWEYNSENNTIESQTEWLVEPNPDDNEEGIKVGVISTFSAMSGNDIAADIRLICAAPEMFEILQKIFYERDVYTGGVNCRLTTEELDEIKNLLTKINQ